MDNQMADEGFRLTVRDAGPTLEKITDLGYRGRVSDLSLEEIDSVLFHLGNLTGQLEAVRATKTGEFDTAERKDNES